MLIYTSNISSRFRYIVEVLFAGVAEYTDSREKFTSHLGVKICYYKEKISSNTLWMVPHGLLDENDIHEQQTVCTEWKKKKIFFATAGDIPFDIFAASFWLVSRYEEYLAHELDEYGRFAHTNSLAYKEGFLNTPLVNEWMQLLETQVCERCSAPRFNINATRFSFVPTYDIDIAYSYKHQSPVRNVLGFYRDLLEGKFEQVVERANVYSGRKPDPFDVYDWLDELHERYKLHPVYFFLLAEKRKGVDKNIGPHTKGMQELIERHAKLYTTGIHPSWQSGDSDEVLKTEIGILEKTSGKEVVRSRQHYLRMRLPETYRRLIAAGIKEDYSMAYGTVNGFRASYALPFAWFDLEKNMATSLIIHSFCYMDSTAVFQQREKEEEASAELQHYYEIVRSVKGELVTLFHNDFLTEQPEWIAWRKMYENFLAKKFGAIT